MEEIKELPNTFLFKGYLKYKHLKLKTDFGSSAGGLGGEKRKANKDNLILWKYSTCQSFPLIFFYLGNMQGS